MEASPLLSVKKKKKKTVATEESTEIQIPLLRELYLHNRTIYEPFFNKKQKKKKKRGNQYQIKNNNIHQHAKRNNRNVDGRESVCERIIISNSRTAPL